MFETVRAELLEAYRLLSSLMPNGVIFQQAESRKDMIFCLLLFDQHDSVDCNAFFAAFKTQFFGGGGFYVNLVDLDL